MNKPAYRHVNIRMDDHSKHKKAKGTKMCVIKRRLMFENYTDCLFNDKLKLKSKKIF